MALQFTDASTLACPLWHCYGMDVNIQLCQHRLDPHSSFGLETLALPINYHFTVTGDTV